MVWVHLTGELLLRWTTTQEETTYLAFGYENTIAFVLITLVTLCAGECYGHSSCEGKQQSGVLIIFAQEKVKAFLMLVLL